MKKNKIISIILVVTLLLCGYIAPVAAAGQSKTISIEKEIINRNWNSYHIQINGITIDNMIDEYIYDNGDNLLIYSEDNCTTYVKNSGGTMVVWDNQGYYEEYNNLHESDSLSRGMYSQSIGVSENQNGEVFPTYYRPWTSYNWTYGHLNFYRGIAIGVVVSILLGAFGFSGVMSSIVGTVASAVISEGLTDVWFARGTRYRWDYENEQYLMGTLVKYYRNSDRTNLIKSVYTESRHSYYT